MYGLLHNSSTRKKLVVFYTLRVNSFPAVLSRVLLDVCGWRIFHLPFSFSRLRQPQTVKSLRVNHSITSVLVLETRLQLWNVLIPYSGSGQHALDYHCYHLYAEAFHMLNGFVSLGHTSGRKLEILVGTHSVTSVVKGNTCEPYDAHTIGLALGFPVSNTISVCINQVWWKNNIVTIWRA